MFYVQNPRHFVFWAAFGLATGLIAWASMLPAHQGPGKSEHILHQAIAKGAQQVGPAAAHMRMADQALKQASRLTQTGDNHRATYALMRAEADAELALALACEAPAEAEAHDALEQVQSFQQENAL